ncbi:MAG TPA: Rieske 2Fe-2S domain-containing protein [Chitinophagales bacterium]|nr:Rieske 2Fe-2S domain-containing protein [Chitinophagales bacterium]HRK28426.1 Rieske 2Fe-2S domain-containing protein [Chitinophagales bacterium]
MPNLPDYDWVKIAPLPDAGKELIARNTVARLEVAGKTLYLANYEGSYYAGNARCPHAGGALDKGRLSADGCVVCPLHRFCFNLQSGKEQTVEGFSVPVYPVKQADDGFYIGFPKNKWWFW